MAAEAAFVLSLDKRISPHTPHTPHPTPYTLTKNPLSAWQIDSANPPALGHYCFPSLQK
ncbi:MAG: hypothetical protein F6J93_01915 [Oscillatoria sp. SIO1A7]|nr:hypothetical protein [Oscillatoria sp. SIO1A7]